MDIPLAQLYNHVAIPDQNSINAVTQGIMQIYNIPENINQIYSILANREFSSSIRHQAAIGLKQMIFHHKELYVQNPSASFHDLLAIMLSETDIIIGEHVSFALCPIFEAHGEEWTEVTELIRNLCLADQSNNSCIIGSLFLIMFLPYTRLAYVCQILGDLIIPLLQKLLSNPESAIYGFRLFSIVQQEDELPQEFNTYFVQLFDQMLNIYHQYLANSHNSASKLTVFISRSLKSDLPFDSPINTCQKLMNLAAQANIPNIYRHLPMYPIKTLLKHHGKELRQLIPSAMSLFIQISISQFNGTGFRDDDMASSIIDLFSIIADIENNSGYFNNLMMIVCKEPDPAASFASLCAIYGSLDPLIDEFEKNIKIVLDYILSKLNIRNPSIVEVCLLILCDLVFQLNDSMPPFSSQLFEVAFFWSNAPEFETSKYAISLIATIFNSVDLDPSVVLPLMTNLKNTYCNASEDLKPELMSAIAAGIYSCRDDAKYFADQFIETVYDGFRSQNILICIASIEAMSNLMCFAKDQVQSIYEDAIVRIHDGAGDQEGDVNMRGACMSALVNIFNVQQDFPPNFVPFILSTAIATIGTPVTSEDELSSDAGTSMSDIIVYGFKLMKAIFKYHSDDCRIYDQAYPMLFSNFIHFFKSNVAVEAIRASTYYLLYYNPNNTDLFNEYNWACTEQPKKKICIAAFKAYSKLLSQGNQSAIQCLKIFIDNVFKALSRMLPCQISKCENEEERFSFDPTLNEPVYSILCESFNINIQLIAPVQLMQLMNSLLQKVNETESLEILGTLGDYVFHGGKCNDANLVQYALSKFEFIDYSQGPDAIYFIRSLIKFHPESVASNIGQIIASFYQHLTVEVSSNHYYWKTITNIIAALFDIAKSPIFQNSIQMNQVMPLILEKLPVKGDDDEAAFIYECLISYYQSNPNEINTHLVKLITALAQTLSLKNKSFLNYNLPPTITQSLIVLTKTILQSKPEINIGELIGGDQFKFARLQERLTA